MPIDLTPINDIIEQIQTGATPAPNTTEGIEMQNILKGTFAELNALFAAEYATKQEITDGLGLKSNDGHNHDERYYPQAQTYTQEEIEGLVELEGGKSRLHKNVPNQTAMLNLMANKADFAIRIDTNEIYFLENTPASELTNWVFFAPYSPASVPADILQNKISWNATTNTPPLSDVSGSINNIYMVSVAGTHDFGGGNIVSFDVNDLVLFNGTNHVKNSALGSGSSPTPNALIKQGDWNANTNTPTLADGTGTQGHFYVVTVAGTANLGSGDISFEAGDWVWYNAGVWGKIVVSGQVPTSFNVNTIYEKFQSITVSTAIFPPINPLDGGTVFVQIDHTGAVSMSNVLTTAFTNLVADHITRITLIVSGNAQNIIFPDLTKQYSADATKYVTNVLVKRTTTDVQEINIMIKGTSEIIVKSMEA